MEIALTAVRHLKNRAVEGVTLSNLSMSYNDLGESRRAIELCEQALIIACETDDKRVEGNTLVNMSLALNTLGEREQAISFAEAALEVYEHLESPYAEAVQKMLAHWCEQQEE